MAEVTIKKLSPTAILLAFAALILTAFSGGEDGPPSKVLSKLLDLCLTLSKRDGQEMCWMLARGCPGDLREQIESLEQIMTERQKRGEPRTAEAILWIAPAGSTPPTSGPCRISPDARKFASFTWFGRLPESLSPWDARR
jgi:hypothetical protein